MAMTRIADGGNGKHTWISNRAFTRMTGIKRVCLTCGQSNMNATKVCPRPLGSAALTPVEMGKKGGKSRQASMSAAQRSELARKAAKARWKKAKAKRC